MPTSRKIILSLNITKSIFASYNPKPIIIEFNSITEAEQKLGIDKSSIHKMLEENRELEGILAIIQGTMGFEKHTDKQNNKINKRENDKEKMIKHLEAKANYCKKHKVNYVKTLTQCPLCKLDEAKKKFKML
mgnify:CR=1 FL=1|jgi:hypothetical protein|tara:strand:- start:908 stop:1303 length:396 start_codon:yes stop_codon:yes gene_type:complete